MTITLTWVDAIWVVMSLGGYVFSSLTIAQYIAAFPKARAVKNTDDRRVAIDLVHDYAISEGMRLIGHWLSLTLGVWAVFIPPMPQQETPVSAIVFEAAFLFVLFALNGLLLANSVRAWLAWRRRYGMVARGNRRGVRHRREGG